MDRMTRKARFREQGRQEILEAAMALFGEKGYHGVSMHEIAVKAGVAVGTLYNFFASKEDLYTALMETCVGGVADVIMPILDDPRIDPLEKIRNMIKAHDRLVHENASYIRLSQSRYSDFGRKVKREIVVQATIQRIQNRMAEVLAEGVGQGIFRDINPAFTAELLRTIMESAAFWSTQQPHPGLATKITETIETLFLHGIIKDASHA
jgi:TetR/AcrR family transcriptional regulator